jgi:cobalt-zinc-cadmium resistance protein CzcA
LKERFPPGSSANQLRSEGLPLYDAIMQGAEKRVRPMTMTALTAILGLLPAALSTKIGAQTQQPLAIVVVDGTCMTLVLNRYLMPVLYSLSGNRTPPAGAAVSRLMSQVFEPSQLANSAGCQTRPK